MKQDIILNPETSYRYNDRDDRMQNHFHSHYEIYYLISGRRRYTLENEIYDLVPGDLVLIPPMLMHKTLITPGCALPHERFLLGTYEVPDIFLNCFQVHYYHPTGAVSERIAQIIAECREATEQAPLLRNMLLQANLTRLLASLSRLPREQFDPSALSEGDRAMQSAAYYIKENCEKPLTLGDVAAHFFLTREYFSTRFKNSIGLGFSEYLNHMRISRALVKLINTDDSILLISEACGFNDSNYFATVFKKLVGRSPAAYRKAYRNDRHADTRAFSETALL